MLYRGAWIAVMLLGALMPTSAGAQALEPEAEEALRDQEARGEQPAAAEAPDERLFRPGSVDILLGLGLDFGGLFYPHIEPGIDIGVIPVGEDITISVGASVDLGYCVLCGLLSLVPNVETFTSYYIAPTGRVLAHLNFISKLAKMPELDISGGLLVSPSIYQFNLSYQDVKYEQRDIVVSFGPVFAGRYVLDSGLLVFLEYRYLVSTGFSDAKVTGADGSVYDFNTGEFGRYGQSYTVGVGYRL
jgi:hypothetical protein